MMDGHKIDLVHNIGPAQLSGAPDVDSNQNAVRAIGGV
jgi:hypothetical protein